jgi:metallo-beta-lactamase family protein
MKVTFCGAAQSVTGSSHLLELKNGHKVLLDCGLYQGNATEMENYNTSWDYFDPKDIDFLILSHAHIDHIGRVPRLVRDGFRGEILCTHATRSLASIMLMDAAKIYEEDDNKEPLFTKKDVSAMLRMVTGLSYERWHFVEVGLDVLFRDAGHILGSSSVTLKIEEEGKEEPILFGFTGDIGRPERPILKDPIPMPEVDYLICESTYGGKVHKNYTADIKDLLYIVRETCLLNEGKLLIPAFSLGRTQELIYMLDQLETNGDLPHLPVYIDSPLAINAVDIFRTHPECYDEQLQEYLTIDPNPFGFNGLKYQRRGGLSNQLAKSDEPCIIIAASGMMNSGRVVRHLYHLLGDAKNTILSVGYCSPNTLGGALMRGEKYVNLYGKEIKVNARIERLVSFSAHADQQEMWDFIQNQTAVKKLFLVHGEYRTQNNFRDYLQSRGFGEVEVPALGESYELD